MQKLVSLTLHCRTRLPCVGEQEVIIYGILFEYDEVQKGIFASVAPFSIYLLRSVAPHRRSMSQFISFIISRPHHLPSSCCCCASCLAAVALHPLWRRIGISEWIRLWLWHIHTLIFILTNSYSHVLMCTYQLSGSCLRP